MGRPRKMSSTHLEDADLVAIEIAEIGAVESVAAIARRAFVLAAGGKRVGVDLLHDVWRWRRYRHHRAVSADGFSAVIWFADAEHARRSLDAPALHAFVGHRASRAECNESLVVEGTRLFEIVRADRRVADHFYLPVGILLKGTSLSTRMSCGRPSTRSAMMFRRISSVPPAMRRPGAESQPPWNMPCIGASLPCRMPASPSRSIAKAERSCSFEATTILAIDASGPGCLPCDSAVIVRIVG